MKHHYQVFICIVVLLVGILIGVFFPAKYAPQTAVVISSIGNIATALTLMFLVYESFINKSERREQREMINLQRYENHINLFKQRTLSIENDSRYQNLIKFKNADLLYKKIFRENRLDSVTISLSKQDVDDKHIFNFANKSLIKIVNDIRDVTLAENPTIESFSAIFDNIEWLYTDLCLSMRTNSTIGNINGQFDKQSSINVYNLELNLVVIEASLNQLKDFASFGDKTDYTYDTGIDFTCFVKKLMSKLSEAIQLNRLIKTAGVAPLPKNVIGILRQTLKHHINIELGHEDIWLEIELLINLLDEKITKNEKINLDSMRRAILYNNESNGQLTDFNEIIKLLEVTSHTAIANSTKQDDSIQFIAQLLTNITEYRQRNERGQQAI